MKLNRRKFIAYSGAAAGASTLNLSLLSQAVSSQLAWPRGRALPIFPQPSYLEAADLTTLSGDQQTLLVSLQGIVNRQLPRLYFYWGTDPTTQEWLTTSGVPYSTTTDPMGLVSKYRSEIAGAVVWDQNLPDTLNLATNVAGLKGGVVATAALAKSLNLPVLQDFTGQFSNKLDAYNWALTNIWPKMTNRILTAISPTNSVAVPNVQWTTLLEVTQPITDASNKAVYTADLSSFLGGEAVYVKYQDAYPSDGWGPSVSQVTVTANGNVIASFQPGTSAEAPFLFDADSSQLASGWRFADGTEYFIYKFVPPAGTTQLTLQTEMWNEYFVTATSTAPSIQVGNPNFRDYIVAVNAPVIWLDPDVTTEAALFAQVLQTMQPDTPYLGWFPNGDEQPGVALCGQYSSAVLASDYFLNGTVLSGVSASVKTTKKSLPVPKIANKIYLTLTMVEGDNIQYDQHRMRQIWDDPNRGQTPINWSVNILLADIAPIMLNYFQQTQTDNDLLVAGPSGAGYTYPAVWPASTLPGYMQRTGQYMQRTGMNIIFAYNRNATTDLTFSTSIIDLYKQYVPGLLGIVYNYESSSQISLIDGLPVATLLGLTDLSSSQSALASVASSWSGTSPLFIAGGVESWNMAPTDVNTLVSSLGSEFVVLRGDTFFQLYKASQSTS